MFKSNVFFKYNFGSDANLCVVPNLDINYRNKSEELLIINFPNLNSFGKTILLEE